MLRYDHLVGLKFEHGVQDCYSLVRAFYKDNFDLNLPNYARPNDWWAHGMDMYYDKFHKNGFRPIDVHPSEYQVGDLFIMNVRSSVGNHAGMMVENGQILHHLWGRLSSVDNYRGIWRNSTTAVLRHKDIVIADEVNTQNLLDLVSPHTRRKIDEALKNHPTAGQTE